MITMVTNLVVMVTKYKVLKYDGMNRSQIVAMVTIFSQICIFNWLLCDSAISAI